MNPIPLNTSFVAGVALATIEGTKKILLLKRKKESFWCHVTGKIEDNETAWQAFIRELREETGVLINHLYSAEYIEQFYEHQKNCITLVPIFVALLPNDTEICINEEHTEYKWCSLDEAKALVPFPNQRVVYDHVWQVFVENKPSELMRIKIS